MASVLEARGTEKATNWPVEIAPYEVHIVPVDYTKTEQIKCIADDLYKGLLNLKLDVLLDDRNKSAGVKFADADLIGANIRIVVSKRNLEQNKFEVKIKGNDEAILVDVEDIYTKIEEIMKGWKK